MDIEEILSSLKTLKFKSERSNNPVQEELDLLEEAVDALENYKVVKKLGTNKSKLSKDDSDMKMKMPVPHDYIIKYYNYLTSNGELDIDKLEVNEITLKADRGYRAYYKFLYGMCEKPDYIFPWVYGYKTKNGETHLFNTDWKNPFPCSRSGAPL